MSDEHADDATDREDGPASASDPLADLAAEIDERRTRKAADEGVFADAFEKAGPDEVSEDALWTALSEPATETVDAEADRDVRVVPSRTCHGCRYFATPPEVACTHDGTEILEVVDTEHFCVVDCPVVADRGEEDFSASDR